MPTPIYMRIDGIDGESLDARHRDWIDVLSFSAGVARSDATSSGRARSAAEFAPLSITKPVDAATTDLLLAAASGRVLRSVQLSVLRSGGDAQDRPYYDVALRNVLVTAVRTSGDSDGPQILEEVSFTYQEIEWTYHQGSGDGATTEESASWNLGSGKAK